MNTLLGEFDSLLVYIYNSLGGSQILESIGIKWGIVFKCDRLLWINTFAALFLSIYTLSDELE